MPNPFIVCELSANHLGSLERALAIVDAAADAGADAIKLQTWTPDTMCISRDYVLEHGPWQGRALFDLYRECFTPWEWHAPIFEHARKRGLEPFSAAFDRGAVDFLEMLGVKRHKVASFELTDLPLIRYMASKGRPMILSTGMATQAELDAAFGSCVQLTPSFGCRVPIVLRCTSAYPAPPSSANLQAHPFGSEQPWGISDHTEGIGVAVAACALGATMIEKHLTLSRADGGPDAGFSMEPAEFKQLVVECRRAAAAIGQVRYGPTPGESPHLRRSLWVCKDVEGGEPLVLGHNVCTARPALGLHPGFSLDGKTAAATIKAGQPLTAECIA